MAALPLQRPETVTALTARIKGGLEQWFRDVWVEGELSNVKFMASSPHAYFTVKDAGAQLPCAFFHAARNAALRAVLRDGAKVRLRGAISVYAPRGAYQLLVRPAEPVGEGELMLRFEALKRALAAEGLFDPARKRPIPALPRTVGVVTSPTGAAIRDILDVLGRRFSGVRVLLAPARVQGDGAAAEVVAGIELLNALPEPPDVLIVGRGGGSLEDLWCFNDERVARAVRASRVPVVSAVGHEIDFTICDFAADLRAPTPSAAAELVVANRADLAKRVESRSGRLARAARGAVSAARARVDLCARSRAFGRPADLVRHHAQRVDLLSQRLDASLAGSIRRSKTGGYVFHYHAPVLILTANRADYDNNMADCACALENMMLMANALDLGSCWVNQLKWLNRAPEMTQALREIGLEENEIVLGGAVFGYPNTESGLPNREPLPRKGNPVTWIE